MVPAPDARRVAYARFVRRAVDHAKDSRDWTVAQIAQAAGEDRISRSTIFRWMKGDWQTEPKPRQVVAFCDALDIPVTAAFLILWPGKTDRPEQPEPLPTDPDIELLLRRLHDPNVPQAEKYHIKETIRGLVSRTISRRREEGRRDVG